MDWTVTPESDPTPDGYFWSHQVAIIGGEAAYAGLQTVGAEPKGKIAIFSVWNAMGAASPSYAAPFGGEGVGWSVRIPFQWEVGATYPFSIMRSGDTWEARVDGDAIGTITVRAEWEGLAASSIMWTERYGGALSRCSDIGFASAVFGEPTAHGGAGRVRPLGHRNYLGNPLGCPGSRVEDVAVGVRHVMGARADPSRPERRGLLGRLRPRL
jgi:hypothetical protein